MGSGGSKGYDDVEDIVISDPVGNRQTREEKRSEYAVYSSGDDGGKKLPVAAAVVSSDPGPMATEEHSSMQRSTPRPMWYTLVPLLVIFACLVLTAGVRCRLDEDCSLLSAPSLGHFLNNTDTSALAVSSLNALIGVHYMLNVATVHMLKNTSAVSVVLTIIASILLYVSVYACLLFPYWYIAIAALGAGGLWSMAICHGLRKYYAYRRVSRKLAFIFSVFFLSVYLAAMVLYIVLSAVPAIQFQGKQTGVFVSEIILLASGALFCALLVFHTRGVTYMFQVKKSYTVGFEQF